MPHRPLVIDGDGFEIRATQANLQLSPRLLLRRALFARHPRRPEATVPRVLGAADPCRVSPEAESDEAFAIAFSHLPENQGERRRLADFSTEAFSSPVRADLRQVLDRSSVVGDSPAPASLALRPPAGTQARLALTPRSRPPNFPPARLLLSWNPTIHVLDARYPVLPFRPTRSGARGRDGRVLLLGLGLRHELGYARRDRRMGRAGRVRCPRPADVMPAYGPRLDRAGDRLQPQDTRLHGLRRMHAQHALRPAQRLPTGALRPGRWARGRDLRTRPVRLHASADAAPRWRNREPGLDDGVVRPRRRDARHGQLQLPPVRDLTGVALSTKDFGHADWCGACAEIVSVSGKRVRVQIVDQCSGCKDLSLDVPSGPNTPGSLLSDPDLLTAYECPGYDGSLPIAWHIVPCETEGACVSPTSPASTRGRRPFG